MAKTKTKTKTKALPYVVVRCEAAGVHVGLLARRAGREVELHTARRVWSWDGAHTLHEMALRGVALSSKVSEPVPAITLTDAIEIIPASEEAAANLCTAGWSK